MVKYLEGKKTDTSVVLVSVMLAFSHKKDAIKRIFKIYCLCFYLFLPLTTIFISINLSTNLSINLND